MSLNKENEEKVYAALYETKKYMEDCQTLVQRKIILSNLRTHRVIINCSSIDLARSLSAPDSQGGKYIDMTKYSRPGDIDRLFIPEKKPLILDFLYPGQNKQFYQKLHQRTPNKFIIIIDQDVFFQDLTGKVLYKWQIIQLQEQKLVQLEFFNIIKKDLEVMTFKSVNYHDIFFQQSNKSESKIQLMKSLIGASKENHDKINKEEYEQALQQAINSKNISSYRKLPQYTPKHDGFKLLQQNMEISSSPLRLFENIHRQYFQTYTNIIAKFLLAQLMSDMIESCDYIFDFMPDPCYFFALQTMFSLVSPLRETMNKYQLESQYISHKELNSAGHYNYDIPKLLYLDIKSFPYIDYIDDESSEFSGIDSK